MTMLTMLREEQAKHPAGSDLQKLLCWCELHIGDQFDRIAELEDEIARIDAEQALRIAGMIQMREHLDAAVECMQAENFDLPRGATLCNLPAFQKAMTVLGVDVAEKKKSRKKPTNLKGKTA